MAGDDQAATEEVEKSGKGGLLIGLAGAVLLGSGGFYAAYSGLIGGAKPAENQVAGPTVPAGESLSEIAFIPLDPLVISLRSQAVSRYLKFSAQLEIEAGFRDEVILLKPRVADVLNGFLRAVDSRDIEDPSSLSRLRAQMLRRVQVVTGEGRVRDLLVTEFVLN